MADYVLEGVKWGTSVLGSPGGTVTYALDASLPGTFVGEITRAFAEWSSVAAINFQQVAAGTASNIALKYAPIDGAYNVVGNTGYTYSLSGGGSYPVFQSATVTFDSAEKWSLASPGSVAGGDVDLYTVALHEIGHAIGLGHYEGTIAVMNAVEDHRATDLLPSDIHAADALYGAPSTDTTATHPVFRFYDTVTNDHFYTTSATEAASIKANLPTLSPEGAPWSTPDKTAGTVDVFRFFDTVTKTHFLTTNAGEVDTILKTLPTFTYEGVAFQAYANAGASGTFALERFYNTNSHVHTYAADASEAALIKSGAVGQGWVDEGASFVVHQADGHTA